MNHCTSSCSSITQLLHLNSEPSRWQPLVVTDDRKLCHPELDTMLLLTLVP